jgi:hypothetical protein
VRIKDASEPVAEFRFGPVAEFRFGKIRVFPLLEPDTMMIQAADSMDFPRSQTDALADCTLPSRA